MEAKPKGLDVAERIVDTAVPSHREATVESPSPTVLLHPLSRTRHQHQFASVIANACPVHGHVTPALAATYAAPCLGHEDVSVAPAVTCTAPAVHHEKAACGAPAPAATCTARAPVVQLTPHELAESVEQIVDLPVPSHNEKIAKLIQPTPHMCTSCRMPWSSLQSPFHRPWVQQRQLHEPQWSISPTRPSGTSHESQTVQRCGALLGSTRTHLGQDWSSLAHPGCSSLDIHCNGQQVVAMAVLRAVGVLCPPCTIRMSE